MQRPQIAAKNSTLPTLTSTNLQAPVSSLNKKPANQIRLHLPSQMVAKLPLVSLGEGQIAVSVYGGKNGMFFSSTIRLVNIISFAASHVTYRTCGKSSFKHECAASQLSHDRPLKFCPFTCFCT